MGNCLSKKNQSQASMGGTFSGSKGSSIEVAKKSENLSLIQNDQNSGPKETTLKNIKQQHMEKALDSAEQMIENETFSNKPTIKLLPHEHTLFCERKQRVCMSVGRLQEYETLQIEGLLDEYASFVWVRRPPTAINSPDHSADEIIENSENQVQYKLTKRDVGLHICVRLTKESAAPVDATVPSSSGSNGNSSSSSSVYTASLGPVLPGPPRILDFTVTGSLAVGSAAVASYEYIGGFEGVSEVWWMRIHPDGKREQITSETGGGGAAGGGETAEGQGAAAATGTKEYVLTQADAGCTLKAKCRPSRSDGVKGEIFTSKSSGVVVLGGAAEAEAEANGESSENDNDGKKEMEVGESNEPANEGAAATSNKEENETIAQSVVEMETEQQQTVASEALVSESAESS